MEYKRIPQDEDEERLLDGGWEFAGLSLFRHPKLAYMGAVTKEQALEEHMEFYCPACGACGEEGCCSPDVCKCMYGEHYKTTYKELSDCNDHMYRLCMDMYGYLNGFIKHTPTTKYTEAAETFVENNMNEKGEFDPYLKCFEDRKYVSVELDINIEETE